MVCAALSAVIASAEISHTDTVDFANLSIEELMNETITSVSKREQLLFDTASAVTLFSNQDIRRSGATSIADALRLVPGVNVGSATSSQWAISARGYNNVFANKLLVLVDGRAAYTPLFAGVYWELIQPTLEDVDRIEVIRGPGATIWGANAVNGVINIVTRSAKDSQGGLLFASAGDLYETNSGARYGGQLGAKTYYRVDAAAFAKDDFRLANGQSADDSWRGEQGSLRVDHHPDEETQLTWHSGWTGMNTDDDAVRSHNFYTIGRLSKEWTDRSGVEVQVYYDQIEVDDLSRSHHKTDTVDFAAQQTFGIGEYNDVIWGVGYRNSRITSEQTNFAYLVRTHEVDSQLYSFFVQDEFRLTPKLTLTGGVKLEHNDYTGVEVQPSIRGAFKPTKEQTLWAAVSRAVRTPAAFESQDISAILLGPPFAGPGGVYVPRIVSNPDLKSEVMWAYEMGYRVQPTNRLSVDVAVFYNAYSELVGLGAMTNLIPGTPVGTAELPFDNTLGDGKSYGSEISVTVSATPSWRLNASYSWLINEFSASASVNPYERGSPRHQVVLRSSHDFTSRLSMNAQFRYVDVVQSVPSYITADLQFSYHLNDRVEVSVVGQNLLDKQHPEQAPFVVLSTAGEVPRSVYCKVTCRF